MFDQSFSVSNFQTIFSIEHRKGHIDYNRMPQAYKDEVANIQRLRGEISKQRRKKRDKWTEKEINDYYNNKELLRLCSDAKERVLLTELERQAKEINAHNFHFMLQKWTVDKKEYFCIDPTNKAQLIAMKCMQRNVVKMFNVEIVNRHTVMTNLKLLLNNNLPIYIIRTDVKSFFESIKQERLMELVSRNSLLSNKTKELISMVFSAYEQLKDKNKVPYGKGVPRGVGISSPLTEVYMADVDKELRNKREMVFYARYVDDIFMVLSDLGSYKDMPSYYNALKEKFEKVGLSLQDIGSDKCKLIDLYKPSNGLDTELEYLGYRLYISTRTKNGRKTVFGLSQRRKDKFKTRVDNVFERFGHVVRVSTKKARRDLKDGLKLITGNIRLVKAKSGVKVGFFYNNDLLDREDDFNELEQYLKGKPLPISANVFSVAADKTAYEAKLRSYIDGISLKRRWEDRKTYQIDNDRLKEIERWL